MLLSTFVCWCFCENGCFLFSWVGNFREWKNLFFCISVIVSVTIHTGEDPQVLLYTLTQKIVRARNGVKQERHREVDCFDLVTQP